MKEVYPIKRQLVSVEKIKIIEDIKLFDFCKDMSTIDNLLAKVNIQIISKNFLNQIAKKIKNIIPHNIYVTILKSLDLIALNFIVP